MNDYNSGLVSIITATYNSEEFVKQTYQSIVSQSYENWEWLVTDDCSKDNTWDILKKLSRIDSRVRISRNEINQGAAVSRNNSIERSTGEFLAFLDSDDLWKPNKLKEQIKFMGDDIHFSFTAYELISEKSEKLNSTVDSTQYGEFDYFDMLKKKATLGCSTVILRRQFVGAALMPLLRTGQDYAYWLKILKSGLKAHVLPQVLTSYRICPNSISRNKISKAKRQWQIYREIENLGIGISMYYFLLYAFRAVFRKR